MTERYHYPYSLSKAFVNRNRSAIIEYLEYIRVALSSACMDYTSDDISRQSQSLEEFYVKLF